LPAGPDGFATESLTLPVKAPYMDWTGLNVLVCDLTSSNTDAAVVVVPVL
jgi:hypothetical protein